MRKTAVSCYENRGRAGRRAVATQVTWKYFRRRILAKDVFKQDGTQRSGMMSTQQTLSFREREAIDVDTLLPLPLQDLSLLKVINDLDAYPVDLLASLPRWLRYRLLNNLPALDLCRLDHTPVAKGIDVDEFWKPILRELISRYTDRRDSCVTSLIYNVRRPVDEVNSQPLFDLDIAVTHRSRVTRHRLWSRSIRNPFPKQLSAAEERLRAAFKELRQKDECNNIPSVRKGFLLEVLAIILSEPDYTGIKDTLASISGLTLLKSLMPDQSHSFRLKHSNDIWKKQAVAINMCVHSRHNPRRRSEIEERLLFTPLHLSTTFNEENDENNLQKILSLVSTHCPQLSSITIHIDDMLKQVQQALYVARFAQDNGLQLSTLSKACTATVNIALRQVEILRLGCDDYSSVGIMTGMIEAATSDGNECKLKCLFCALPDLYTDIIKPLSGVFSLPNFHHLILEVKAFYMLSLSKLLFAFLTAPCSHKQHLTIEVDKLKLDRHEWNLLDSDVSGASIRIPDELDVADLATFDMGGVTVPQCAVEHKVLHPSKSSPSVIHLVLQLPTVRLNELHVDSIKNLHLCSLHPDLQVMKLFIDMNESEKDKKSHTYREDFVRLLMMPTLREISISTYWCNDLKIGLIEGFHKRAESLPDLRKIMFQSYSDIPAKDYQLLRNIF